MPVSVTSFGDKKAAVTGEALIAVALEFPNSVVADFLLYFSPEVVMKLIEVFSGRTIRIPTVSAVWRSYRNKVIFDTLNIKNTRGVRQQLAFFFGIDKVRVSNLYATMLHKKRVVHPGTAISTIQSVMEKAEGDMLDVLRSAFKSSRSK